MVKSGKKLNLIDFFIIFSVVLIAISAVVQGIAVKRFEENNTIEQTLITLRLIDVDDATVEDIEKGDFIFSSDFSNDESLGVVQQKLKHSLSGNNGQNGTESNEIVEYEIQVMAECLKNSSGFYNLYNKKIIPGMTFAADNGFVGFECEVIDVKSAD